MSEFIAASIFAESSFRHQPQRGCGSKPKVGAHAPTLGERGKTEATATRLWPTSRVMARTNGHNRVAVGMFVGR